MIAITILTAQEVLLVEITTAKPTIHPLEAIGILWLTVVKRHLQDALEPHTPTGVAVRTLSLVMLEVETVIPTLTAWLDSNAEITIVKGISLLPEVIGQDLLTAVKPHLLQQPPPLLLHVVEIRPLTGLAALALAHVISEEVIVIPTLIALEI